MTTVLKILTYPNKALRTASTAITTFDAQLEQTISDLFKTLYMSQSWTITASQVGIPASVFVMDLSEAQNEPMCFINPKIVNQQGSFAYDQECLSFPGVMMKILRPMELTLEYQDATGAPQVYQAEQLAAFCIQHAVEQLNGKTIVDHLSKLKRDRFLKKYEQMRANPHACGSAHCHDHHH